MKAKEMFKKLGYEYSKVGEKIYYEKPNYDGHSLYVVFYTVTEQWDTNITEIKEHGELVSIIIKQIEELGWND